MFLLFTGLSGDETFKTTLKPNMDTGTMLEKYTSTQGPKQ